jgi:hypothetical protein
MMWARELLGWVLVLAGLYVFYVAMQLLLRDTGPFILEGPVFVAIGFFVFRGGLQLIKVGVAARVCLDAQKNALQQEAATAAALRRTPVASPIRLRTGISSAKQ